MLPSCKSNCPVTTQGYQLSDALGLRLGKPAEFLSGQDARVDSDRLAQGFPTELRVMEQKRNLPEHNLLGGMAGTLRSERSICVGGARSREV